MDARKKAICDALRRWIRQRPGLEFGNYGNVSAYRSEMRSITKDRHHAETLLRAVESSDGITADALIEAARSAYSGRLTIEMDWGWQLVTTDRYGKPEGIMAGFETETEARTRLAEWQANNAPVAPHTYVRPARNRAVIRYCTGQYFPTEYRRAVCAVLASALWDYARDKCMPEPGYVQHGSADNLPMRTERVYGPKKQCAGDWLRAHFRREFGRHLADRWFQ